MQMSWRLGVLPVLWLVADIRLIPKGRRPKVCKDFRPITHLSIAGKLMERVVQRRISFVAESSGWFRDYQSGFRKERSCIDVVTNIQQQVHSAFAKRQCVVGVQIDIAGAYDSVWHDGMRMRMRELGVHSHMLRWLSAFLSNRWSSVTWNTARGDWHPVTRGLPHGSPLSPDLFNLYVATLLDGLVGVNRNMYVDDATLTATAARPQDAGPPLNSALSVVSK